MGFNVRDSCNERCSDCPAFGVFSSTVEFVDYLEPVRFVEDVVTKQGGVSPIHIDGNGNIRIEQPGIYWISTKVLVGSRSFWALFKTDRLGADVIIPYSYMTNQLTEETLMRQSYSQDDNALLFSGSAVPISEPTTIKLKNLTASETGQSGVDRTGAVKTGDGFMVKILSKGNVISGVPFPGVVLEVYKQF